MFHSSGGIEIGEIPMKSMFTVTLSGKPVSVVISSTGDDAMEMTRRLMTLEAGSLAPNPSSMCARRPTHQESTAFFVRQRVWSGEANVAGFLL
jgi:hypothetical protein